MVGRIPFRILPTEGIRVESLHRHARPYLCDELAGTEGQEQVNAANERLGLVEDQLEHFQVRDGVM